MEITVYHTAEAHSHTSKLAVLDWAFGDLRYDSSRFLARCTFSI